MYEVLHIAQSILRVMSVHVHDGCLWSMFYGQCFWFMSNYTTPPSRHMNTKLARINGVSSVVYHEVLILPSLVVGYRQSVKYIRMYVEGCMQAIHNRWDSHSTMLQRRSIPHVISPLGLEYSSTVKTTSVNPSDVFGTLISDRHYASLPLTPSPSDSVQLTSVQGKSRYALYLMYPTDQKTEKKRSHSTDYHSLFQSITFFIPPSFPSIWEKHTSQMINAHE